MKNCLFKLSPTIAKSLNSEWQIELAVFALASKRKGGGKSGPFPPFFFKTWEPLENRLLFHFQGTSLHPCIHRSHRSWSVPQGRVQQVDMWMMTFYTPCGVSLASLAAVSCLIARKQDRRVCVGLNNPAPSLWCSRPNKEVMHCWVPDFLPPSS